MYLVAYDKIKIFVKTKITETDSGVGIFTKEGVLCSYNNISSHGISVYVRFMYVHIVQT